MHEFRDAIDCREVEHVPVDGGLAVDHRARHFAERTYGVLGPGVELPPRRVLRGDPEPERAHGAVGRSDARGRALEALVAREERAAEHRCEHRGAGRDPQSDERDPLEPPGETRPRQPERGREAPERCHLPNTSKLL